MEEIAQVREARATFYAEQGIEAPALTAVGVAGLAIEGARIEIEAYAALE
jgi:enamine deaminase RidA (YjgF/YER057c/UK114 family)